ncbi:MAG: GIY-YIG nuclease family protein [Patescibacteria group bacterium]
MAWYAYILLCDNRTYYVGSTSDIQKRFGEHLSGYSPFTSKFSTFDLAYQEELPNRFTAERREQ